MIASRRPAQTPRPSSGDGAPASPPSMLARGVARIDDARHATAFWRAAAVVVCVVVAYNYSLQTLVQEMGQQTPLAYLGLVPLIALLLGVVLAQRRSGAPNIHDRYLDYIVGVPLLTLAMCLLIIAPEGLPSVYWLHRLDLLSLPLFAAGAISLAFGVRALVRVRAAVLFLFLAWPYPYIVLLDHELTWFTDTTAAAVKAVLQFVPVASVAPDGDFLVSHASGVKSELHRLGELRVLGDQQWPRLSDRRRGCHDPDARSALDEAALAGMRNGIPVRGERRQNPRGPGGGWGVG